MLTDFFSKQTLLEGDYKLPQIEIECEIGRGHSNVYGVKINGSLYAMKQLEIDTDYRYHSFLKEISMLRDLSAINRYLVGYEGYFVTVAKE